MKRQDIVQLIESLDQLRDAVHSLRVLADNPADARRVVLYDMHLDIADAGLGAAIRVQRARLRAIDEALGEAGGLKHE